MPAPPSPQTRNSNGLDQFFASIEGSSGLSILDLSGASQANITFITNLGHRLYSDDIVRSLDDAFGGGGDFYENQNDGARADTFLAQTLDFPEQSLDGALVWDTLQFLSGPLLQNAVDRLSRILRPNAYLLAFFTSDEKSPQIPLYSYRIVDSRTLSLAARGQRRPAQFFNNRSIEKLFQKFSSVKFFLTRDSLREIIVRR